MLDDPDDPFAGRSADPLRYFSDLVDAYARFRPGYPADAIDAIIAGLPPDWRAADIGCGTGISARLLASRGGDVIALDPNPDMLEAARRDPDPVNRRIDYRVGSGEDTGLPDASLDLVLCAQAFHWFEAERALREFHRILRSSGRLALVWNAPEPGDAAGRAYAQIVARAQEAAQSSGRIVERHRSADPSIGGWFTKVRRAYFDNPQTYDRAALLGRARSASYFPTAGPLHDELIESLHALFERYERGGEVTIGVRTLVVLADRSRSFNVESSRNEGDNETASS